MAGVDFELVLQVVLFILGVWGTGRLFKLCKQPAILGYLLCGIVMGPQFLDIVPYASTGRCDTLLSRRLDEATNGTANGTLALVDGSASGSASGSTGCDDMAWGRFTLGLHTVSIWVFIGNVGVTLMIFQSGMHIHFDKVRQVGRKAFVVAIFGTALPLLVGMLFVGALYGSDHLYPSGFAAGCAFAPTSIDISIKLLDESKMLNTLAGQTTITAAFIDDIFSLAMLVMMQSLADDNVSPQAIILLVVFSFGFLIAGVFLAIKVFCHLPRLLGKVPASKYASVQPRDEIHLFTMIATLCLFAYLTSIKGFIGSHLLGAFVAGMCFVNVPRSQAIWNNQMKRIVKWMVRFFFAASVGFAVPVSEGNFFSWDAFSKGVVLGLVPTILMKIVSGAFAHMRYASAEAEARSRKASWATNYLRAQPQQMLVGMAMVARGEFAYMVAETAQAADYIKGYPGQKMMSKEVYSSVIWALVMATVVSPLLFRWALRVYSRATPAVRSRTISTGRQLMRTDPAAVVLVHPAKGDATGAGEAPAEAPLRDSSHSFVIRIAAKHHIGVQREVLGCLHSSGVDVVEAHVLGVDSPSTSDIDAFVATYVVTPRGAQKDFDDEKLEEMQHALHEILDDADAQVFFEPYDEDFSADGVIEIQVVCQHHPDVLHEMTDTLASMDLDVFKADFTHTKQPVHGATAISTHASTAPSGRSTPTPARSPKSPATPGVGRVTTFDLAEARERAIEHGDLYADGIEFFAIEEKERAVFYAREGDGTHQFSSTRRAAVQLALEKIIHEHGLHGTIVVRVVHESEMSISHRLPKFEHEGSVTVIRCTGPHHPELLHEICDTLHAASLDVIHAEMDETDQGLEQHALYVMGRDADDGAPAASAAGSTMDRAARAALRGSVNELYKTHGLTDRASVSVLPLRGEAGGATTDSPVLRAKTGKEHPVVSGRTKPLLTETLGASSV